MVPNRSDIETVFEFAKLCETVTNIEEAVNAINAVVANLGFSSFIVTGLPLLNSPLEPFVLLDSWPSEWFKRYCSQNYLEVDPVGQNVLATSSPFLWGNAPYRKTRGLAKQIMDEAAEFGLADGFCVPIHSATGWRSAFSFAHEHKVDAGPKERAAAHLLALTAHSRLRVILGEAPSVKQKLTPREREVLVWAAAGKSAWETSVLLVISEATMIAHLDHIRGKLNVATTTHAVVVALQVSELHPY